MSDLESRQPEVPETADHSIDQSKALEEDLKESSKKATDELATDVAGDLMEQPEVAYESKEYVDEATGYKVVLLIPQGFDGNVDFYFSGDRHDNQKTLQLMNLEGVMKSKWKSGKLSAMCLVEGNSGAVKNSAEHANRFKKFNEKGLFSGMLMELGEHLQNEVKGVHLMGWSRGGEAIQRILSKGGVAERIKTVSVLDGTYGGSAELIAFAKNGGALNIAFESNSRTEREAMAVVQALNLPEKEKNVWEGDDGKVKVYATSEGHVEIAQNFGARFLGATEVIVKNPVVNKIAGVEDFVKEFKLRVGDKKRSEEFANWARNQVNATVLRAANVLDTEAKNSPEEKSLRLAALYLSESEKKNGNTTFKVDFKEHQAAEWRIGAGDLLPESVKAIRVYNRFGKVLFDRAERDVKGGRVGYYTKSGKYAYIHSNYVIEVLGPEEAPTRVGSNSEPKMQPKAEEVVGEHVHDEHDHDHGHAHEHNDKESELTEIAAEEPFTKGVDHYGRPVWLRQGAMKAFEDAKKIAERQGAKLRMVYSYRSFVEQQRLWDENINAKYRGDEQAAQLFLSKPGNSPHHTGGAIDIEAYVEGKDGRKKRDQKLLAKILTEAGFVNYKREHWHWEYGTARWAKAKGYTGEIYKKEKSIDKGKLGS